MCQRFFFPFSEAAQKESSTYPKEFFQRDKCMSSFWFDLYPAPGASYGCQEELIAAQQKLSECPPNGRLEVNSVSKQR